MKVNDPNLSPLAQTGTAGVQGTARAPASSGASGSVGGAGDASSSDGVHLSELVRSLRSLAADSPEHLARVDQLARSFANGSYTVDAQATASKMVTDALQRP